MSVRDLRKAYLRLIRSYKPENSPEEFKRIREAYESALSSAQRLDRSVSEDADRPEAPSFPDFEESIRALSSPGPDRVESPLDLWEMACRGEPEAAYRALVDGQRAGRPCEESYLQLYWLLALVPALDPDLEPVDWLIRGLSVLGTDSARTRELLKRELAADPGLSLGDKLTDFFRRRTPPAFVLDLAEARWKAARSEGRWSLILADLDSLRAWMPETDSNAWGQILIISAMNIAWADGRDGDASGKLVQEVETLVHRLCDHSSELHQFEYVQLVKSGLDRLGGRKGPYSGIYQLLAISWDERGPEFRTRLRAYVSQLAQGPSASLQCLDEIQVTASTVLGRLSDLAVPLEYGSYHFLNPTRLDEISPAIARFLARYAWNDYRSLRPSLLNFCLREAVAPDLVARTMAERAEFVLSGKNPLVHAINDDWPLRHVYRACEMARESPDFE